LGCMVLRPKAVVSNRTTATERLCMHRVSTRFQLYQEFTSLNKRPTVLMRLNPAPFWVSETARQICRPRKSSPSLIQRPFPSIQCPHHADFRSLVLGIQRPNLALYHPPPQHSVLRPTVVGDAHSSICIKKIKKQIWVLTAAVKSKSVWTEQCP